MWKRRMNEEPKKEEVQVAPVGVIIVGDNTKEGRNSEYFAPEHWMIVEYVRPFINNSNLNEWSLSEYIVAVEDCLTALRLCTGRKWGCTTNKNNVVIYDESVWKDAYDAQYEAWKYLKWKKENEPQEQYVEFTDMNIYRHTMGDIRKRLDEIESNRKYKEKVIEDAKRQLEEIKNKKGENK